MARLVWSVALTGDGKSDILWRDTSNIAMRIMNTTTATGLTTATEGSERWLPSALPRNAADDIHIANEG